jgi:hypothetical protein
MCFVVFIAANWEAILTIISNSGLTPAPLRQRSGSATPDSLGRTGDRPFASPLDCARRPLKTGDGRPGKTIWLRVPFAVLRMLREAHPLGRE